ncbi:MAG: phosphotransferase [Actinomycetota bacterium]
MNRIPAQIVDLDLAWLNEVAGPAAGLGSVRSFRVERLGQGVGILGELARLHLEYEAGASGPSTLIAKCQSPAPENQFLGQAMGFYLREVNFYRTVATSLDVRVPHPYYVDAGPDGLPFVLLIEEIVGARCPDQISGITLDETRRILDTVARLHARFWDLPELEAMTWLPPMNNPLYKAGRDMALARFPSFKEKFGDRVTPQMMDVIERACNEYPALLDHVAELDHLTFTHTDCRAENYLFGGSAGPDEVTMIDFQLCTRHMGPWDVANLLSGSLPPEIRKDHEMDLLHGYYDRLVELGVQGYTMERCYLDYRRSLLQMCTAQVITSDLQGGNERGEILLENLHLRPVLAATDHSVGELLDEFC